MTCTIEVMLDPAPVEGGWKTCVLDLPGAELLSAWDRAGAPVAATRRGAVLVGPPGAELARARVAVPSDLVAASTLDDAKLDFDRQKLASDERAGRRTLLFSLATAVISAGATIAVALIARPGHPPPAAAPTLHQLVACQESLRRLEQLAPAPTQTLADLRALIQSHDAACKEPLTAAIESSPS